MIDKQAWIENLMSKAVDSKTCDEALKFSQAALNLAHARAQSNEDERMRLELAKG